MWGERWTAEGVVHFAFSGGHARCGDSILREVLPLLEWKYTEVDTVYYNIGTNDYDGGRLDSEGIVEDRIMVIGAIVAMVLSLKDRRPDVQIVVCGLQPRCPFDAQRNDETCYRHILATRQVNKELKMECMERGIVFIDWSQHWEEGGALSYDIFPDEKDLVHPPRRPKIHEKKAYEPLRRALQNRRRHQEVMKVNRGTHPRDLWDAIRTPREPEHQPRLEAGGHQTGRQEQETGLQGADREARPHASPDHSPERLVIDEGREHTDEKEEEDDRRTITISVLAPAAEEGPSVGLSENREEEGQPAATQLQPATTEFKRLLTEGGYPKSQTEAARPVKPSPQTSDWESED